MTLQCRSCRQKFSGLTTFDDHRTGKYVGIHPDYGCRCRTIDEMTARGLRFKNDRWCGEEMPFAAVTARQGSTQGEKTLLDDGAEICASPTSFPESFP